MIGFEHDGAKDRRGYQRSGEFYGDECVEYNRLDGLWKTRSAKRFLYKTKESLQDVWDLLKKDLILLAGSDYDWDKEDGTAVGQVLKTIRPPNSSDVSEEEGAMGLMHGFCNIMQTSAS